MRLKSVYYNVPKEKFNEFIDEFAENCGGYIDGVSVSFKFTSSPKYGKVTIKGYYPRYGNMYNSALKAFLEVLLR